MFERYPPGHVPPFIPPGTYPSPDSVNEFRDNVFKEVKDRFGEIPILEEQPIPAIYDLKKAKESRPYSKYFKDLKGLSEVDVYAVHYIFNVNDPSGAIQHASKKLLLSGVRTGGKTKEQDIREARDTLTRWLELEAAMTLNKPKEA